MVTIAVILEIEGDESVAEQTVESLLDSGVFQDAVNDYDGEKPLRVTSALVKRWPNDSVRRSPGHKST